MKVGDLTGAKPAPVTPQLAVTVLGLLQICPQRWKGGEPRMATSQDLSLHWQAIHLGSEKGTKTTNGVTRHELMSTAS